MKMIYAGAASESLNQVFDFIAKDKDEALQFIRHAYKAGNQKFYIDSDSFSILWELEVLHNSGKMKHIKIIYHNRTQKMTPTQRTRLRDWEEVYD